MDDSDVNGGPAVVAPENPNLEKERVVGEEPETTETEETEVNGDVKSTLKKVAPPRRRLRKAKANSTSTIETKSKTRGQKRKLSERDDLSSEESMEFNGFDVRDTEKLEPGSDVLKKLIAEAESAESPQLKRLRRSTSKNASKSSDKDDLEDDLDSDENKMHIDEGFNLFDHLKKKKDNDFDDKSETDSIGVANSVESETEPHKTEESSVKSANSSANSSPSAVSQKSKASRMSRGASPASSVKQKIVIDMTNPAYKEPFKYGWKRELVYRAGTENSQKRMADIYYYTPKGKKVRSFREVAEFLNTKELTIDNFTFFKEPIGVDDPEKEIIRDAKRVRDSGALTPTPIKKTPAKKTPAKKIVEEPPTKAVAKSPKVAASAFKVKLPAKRGTPKAEVKTLMEESDMLPPQWSSPASRRSQAVVEKTPPAKSKRALKAKVQEPCSIRCSTSMGLIPSLQCCLCLCLYHPECVDGAEFAGSDDYVCKNCQQDSEDAYQHPREQMSPSLTPPPLIPISMLGVQNVKTKHQANSTPPKLQRIPKSESLETQSRGPKMSRSITIPKQAMEKKDNAWYTHNRNEYLHRDGSLPKPAQNIALMAGKKYIVVPKNNAMAVQPAITVKPDKIGDKAPMLKDNSLIDVSNTTENSMNSRSFAKSATKTKTERDKPITDNLGRLESEMNDLTPDVSVAELDESYADSSQIEPKIGNWTLETEFWRKSMAATIKSDPKRLDLKTRRASESKLLKTPAFRGLERSSSADKELIRVHNQPKPLFLDHVRIDKKRQPLVESEQRNFMVSVCAGYDALSRVFQYLKVQELLRAARVCKMWRDLAAHPALWKTVRMKNSQVTDWEGLADSLKRHGTQHLDLRKMLVAGESDDIWKKFVSVIPRVTSLVRLELCRCPVTVVEEVIKSCPQLEVLSAMTIKCDTLNLASVGNLKRCQELKLKAISGMSMVGDLAPLQDLTQLTHLSLTSVKELGERKIDILESLTNLETLELGECSDFPDKFGTTVLKKLQKLERLRLEKGQGSCCTFDILEGVSRMEHLNQLELVNFDVKNGFDKCLANCKNIKRLLIIPTYISQSATSNNMVLGGVTELSNNLTHFVWGVTLELLRVTELFVDQCNQMSKQVTGDSIPVLKPVPCLKLIEETDAENNENQKGEDKQQPNLTNPQVDILPLPQLQKLLLTALPKTRVKILKIPFHATWRQSISDTTTQ